MFSETPGLQPITPAYHVNILRPEQLDTRLETLLQALREGPPMARVANVEVEWLPFTGEFDSFQLKATV